MPLRSPAQTLVAFAIAAFWLLISMSAVAQSRHYTLTAPDGVTLAVQETGNPNGKPILFIHGLLGSRLNWQKQWESPALQHYRLITYDLRGHGLSGKPTDLAAYTQGQRWGNDLDTVIHALDLQKPVLVGWSLGGAVITNYLASHGDDDIAGAVYVDGVVELAPDQIQSHPTIYRNMISADLKTHIDAERTFLRLCFHQQPDQETFDRLVASAALASWHMQSSVQSMSIPAAKGLGETRVPLLFISGAHDALLKAKPTIARARQFNPAINSILYADSGHAPFLEEPERFNRDLLNFMTVANPSRTE